MNKTLIINKKEAENLLSLKECIPVMTETLIDISEGSIQMLQRNMIHHDNGNILALMPSTLNSKNITGSKVIIFPGSETRKAGTNQGIIPIFNTITGELTAIVDGESITVTRTAAASAAATDALARKEARSVAILGAGKQAVAHVEAIASIRKIDRVFVWSITDKSSKEACSYLTNQLDIECIYCKTKESAVKEADIICTVSKASEPILKGSWIKKGTHINAVGACSSLAREVDSDTLNSSLVFVDQMEACMRDAGDILIPMAHGEFDKSQIQGEIGQVMNRKLEGRRDDKDITFFETVGLAVEDLAAAWFIYEKARKKGIGTEVEI